MPHFDSAESTEWFLELLGRSNHYVEFGSGGSTFQAAKLGLAFTSVDSDPKFLEAVEEKIAQAGYRRPNQTLRLSAIGKTGEWGYPQGEFTPQRIETFRRYSDLPSRPKPDLVLVDGRFRVACALKAMKLLKNDREWTLVIDDYVDRPHYHVLSEFAAIDFVGRMALIRSVRDIDLDLDEAIAKFEIDPA